MAKISAHPTPWDTARNKRHPTGLLRLHGKQQKHTTLLNENATCHTLDKTPDGLAQRQSPCLWQERSRVQVPRRQGCHTRPPKHPHNKHTYTLLWIYPYDAVQSL